MYVPRLCCLIATTLVCFTTAAHAQGPWPTMNRPTFFSPVQQFFTPRYTTNTYTTSPMYSPSPSTPINPGVPQCANGRCRHPNSNVPSTTPTQSYYQPGGNISGNTGTGNCANGQCHPGHGSIGTSRLGLPNSSIGLRPLTPNYTEPRSGNLNRLIPLDNGTPANSGYIAPRNPMYRDRESMVSPRQDYAHDPGVRLQ